MDKVAEQGKHKYKLVIFDLDGTLMDTSEGIIASAVYTLQKSGRPALTDEQLRGLIGPPIQASFKKLYSLSDDEAGEMALIFREQYSTKDLLLAKPYEDIFALLQRLKDQGYKLAVATYKREDYAVRLLKEFHFDEYMDVMLGSDMEGKLTKSDIILHCIDILGVDKSEAVMVGDTANDYVGAHNLGIDFIGVTYGFGYKILPEESMEGVLGWARQPLEIEKLL